jgi:arylsulfatase A
MRHPTNPSPGVRATAAALLIALLGAWPPRSVSAASGSADAAARPNILFILADDYGIDGIGCYGSDRFQHKTPHLDALAKSGTRFTRAYSTPICGPSRCLLITGRYGFHTGGLSNETANHPDPAVEPSLARILKQAGYTTGMAGKWRQMGGTAGQWGFDEYLMSDIAGSPSQIRGYVENGRHVQKPEGTYYPDVQQAFALDFLRRHRGDTFFFYYASHLVHDPIVATPDTRPGDSSKRTLYDDNVAYLDKQVGELVAELGKLHLRERTLIVFASDNGTDLTRGPSTIAGRWPVGGKRDMSEGGAHVPLIVNWPGVTPAGRVLDDLVDFTDLLPTLTKTARARLPDGVQFDGHSFAPRLRGMEGTPREWIFVQLRNEWYAREDTWKLNHLGELFDMHEAPFAETLVPAETTDGAAIAARKRLQAVLARLDPATGKTERVRKKDASL